LTLTCSDPVHHPSKKKKKEKRKKSKEENKSPTSFSFSLFFNHLHFLVHPPFSPAFLIFYVSCAFVFFFVCSFAFFRFFLFCFFPISLLPSTELDKFCHDLNITPGAELHRLLSGWYSRNIAYLPRCANFFGERLDMLIHSALLGQVTILLFFQLDCPHPYRNLQQQNKQSIDSALKMFLPSPSPCWAANQAGGRF
jgi:hypothetical protein